MPRVWDVPVHDSTRVRDARVAAEGAAELAGLDRDRADAAALVATELATNLLKHAEGGRLLVEAVPPPDAGDGARQAPVVQIAAVDHGPGMADVAAALRDGYSTTRSLGAGLGTCRRVADDFHLHSTPGRGTVAVARLGATSARSAAPAPARPPDPAPGWPAGPATGRAADPAGGQAANRAGGRAAGPARGETDPARGDTGRATGAAGRSADPAHERTAEPMPGRAPGGLAPGPAPGRTAEPAPGNAEPPLDAAGGAGRATGATGPAASRGHGHVGVRVGGLNVPFGGGEYSGDAWGWVGAGELRTLMLADGLGHGPDASRASAAAVEALHRSPRLSPAELLRQLDAALRGTRGAAVAVAQLDLRERALRFAGIGNIGARLREPDGWRPLLSRPGIVGVHRPATLPEARLPWTDESLLIVHSDGLPSRWTPPTEPGLLTADPALVAAVTIRDASSPARPVRDDTTVAVLAPNPPDRS
ncbi:SpoIIE family protein phosphatase [Streptomyces anandii]|uniref:SpoIIE family protein phosphatase n=1 Tax=Streptomyces anandii TaxID=285454 RepID=UPI0036FF1AEA